MFNRIIYQKILDNYEKSDKVVPLSEYLHNKIKEIEDITNKMKFLKNNLVENDKKWEIAKKHINDEISVTQKKCPHYYTTYHPDPAGGHDSYNECTICGADI